MTTRTYGWKPQLPDIRDHKFSLATPIHLPAVVDLRHKDCPIKDQGQLGSCSANAIGGMYEFDLMRNGHHSFVVSRLFIYYNERLLENTVDSDAGAFLRDGLKVMKKYGVCHETSWAYDVLQFATKPSADCYRQATDHMVTIYSAVGQDLISMKSCLATGKPFVIGFSVYDAFESAEVAATGILNLPTASEKLLGGHAVKVVGYDDNKKHFIVANSWSTSWGDKGYFYIPYDYLTNPNLASDFWTINNITN